MGETDKSLHIYEMLLTRFPFYRNFPQALIETGDIYAKAGDWVSAQEYFERCLREYPDMKGVLDPKIKWVNGKMAQQN